MSKPQKTLEHAIDALADQIENGHLLASTGGEDLLIAAAEKIEILQKANTTLLAHTKKAEANYRAMVAAGEEAVMEIEMRVSAQRHTCGTCGRDTLPDGDCYGCEADRLHRRVLELEKHDQVYAEREKLQKEKFQKALITIERSGVPGAIIVAARTDDHACGWCRGMVTPCPVEVARIALAWCGKEEK